MRAAVLAGALTLIGMTCGAAAGAEQPAGSTPGAAVAQAPRPASTCDAECVRVNTDRAVAGCTPVIEAQAPIDFDWLHRPLPGIFEEAEQPVGTSSVARYRGDLVRFQLLDKDWVRMSYECGYDVGARKVVFINMHPGRLNLPKPGVTASVSLPAPPPPQRFAGPVQASQQQAGAAPNPAASARPPGKPPRIGEPSPITIEQQAPRVRP